MINEKIILQMVEPYLEDNKLDRRMVDSIFSMLSEDEKYDVFDYLEKQDIEIIEDDDVIDDEGIVYFDSEEADDEFEVLYNNSIFTTKDSQLEEEIIKDKWAKNESLCILAQQGNVKALEELCVNNKGLVEKCVNRLYKSGNVRIEKEDLIQAGMIGLIKAVYKFDSSMGNKFTTYSTWWIEQCIRREIDDTGNIIRVPVHMLELIRKVIHKDRQYRQNNISFDEKVELIAEELDIKKEKVLDCFSIQSNILSTTSLDVPVGENKETVLLEFIVDDNKIKTPEEISRNNADKDIIVSALNKLSEREREVLIYRFGLDGQGTRTLETIGHQFGVTRERVRQIESKALRRLSRNVEIKSLATDWNIDTFTLKKIVSVKNNEQK